MRILFKSAGIAGVVSVTRSEKVIVWRSERGNENELKRDKYDARQARRKWRAAALRDSAHTCYIKACGAMLRQPEG